MTNFEDYITFVMNLRYFHFHFKTIKTNFGAKNLFFFKFANHFDFNFLVAVLEVIPAISILFHIKLVNLAIFICFFYKFCPLNFTLFG